MNQKGQTLIEIVTTLGLILIVITALIGMGIVALKTSSSARNRTVAGKLAGEEMELVRAYRDSQGFSNLSDYTTSCGGSNKCHTDGSTITTDKEIITVAEVQFKRWFNLESVGTNKLKVTVNVTWEETGGTKSVQVVSYLSNWK